MRTMFNHKTLSPKHVANRFWLAYSYLKREPISRGLPNEITVELTNYCNLRCIMCPRNKMKRKVGFMDMKLFKKIIDEAAEFAELIDLDLFGESLLHPKATEMIRYCKQKGLLTLISTNMTHVDEKKAKDIIESGLDAIILSFDGATKETYEKIRRGSSYEKTLKNVETFLRVKKELKSKTPFTTLQMIYMKDTQKEANEFLKRWSKSSVNVVRLKPFITLDRDKAWMSALPSAISNKPCIMLWRKLTIYWDGIASPCCNDYDKGFILGDLKKQTIREIWNGKPLVALRKIHLAGKAQEVPLCKGCNPFEASVPMILGSVFVDDLTTKKLLPIFEKMVVKGDTTLLKYF